MFPSSNKSSKSSKRLKVDNKMFVNFYITYRRKKKVENLTKRKKLFFKNWITLMVLMAMQIVWRICLFVPNCKEDEEFDFDKIEVCGGWWGIPKFKELESIQVGVKQMNRYVKLEWMNGGNSKAIQLLPWFESFLRLKTQSSKSQVVDMIALFCSSWRSKMATYVFQISMSFCMICLVLFRML